MGKAGLNPKQRAFVEYYLMCWSFAEAARRAGYSEKSARRIGFQLSTNIHVAKAIKARLSELQMSADEVLKRLTEHGRGTVLPFIRQDSDNVFLDLTSEEAQQHIALVKKVKTKKRRGGKVGEEWEEVETELELHDAQSALVQLGRYHALFTDNLKVNDVDSAIAAELARVAGLGQAEDAGTAEADADAGDSNAGAEPGAA